MRWPTDVRLLRESLDKAVIHIGRAAAAHGIPGWRQSSHLMRKTNRLHARVRTARQYRRHPDLVEEWLAHARSVVSKAEETHGLLPHAEVKPKLLEKIEDALGHARRLVDQVDRRVLCGEVIPHGEKVHSLHKEWVRWIDKGKEGRPPEIGVPVSVIEDQHGFILNHVVMWQGSDTDAAVPLVKGAVERHPGIYSCSFDKGFSSKSNIEELDGILGLNAMPFRGYLNQEKRAREEAKPFKAARNKHSRVESAGNFLDNHGLDRVRSRSGREGFSRNVAMSILAGNILRLGKMVMDRKVAAAKRRKRKRQAH